MKRLTWSGVCVALALSAGLVRGDEAADLFNNLDKNKDGKLEKSEVAEEQLRHFERLLRSGDKDKDGVLTREEFESTAREEEKPVAPPQGEGRPGGPGAGGPGRPGPNPEELFRRIDKDSNGKVSRDEVKSAEIPEPIKNMLSRQFDELKKDELSGEDLRGMRERMGREGGRAMLDRLRQFDKNGDGKISKEELKDVPAEGRERMTQMMERLGRDEIDLKRMEELMGQGGPGGPGRRPGEGQRPMAGRDGERRPAMEEGAPRDGERRPEGPRDGERRPEGGPRDGERRPEGGPRDGERRPEGQPGRGGFRPQLLRVLDTNEDGRISKEELQNAAAQFDRLDRNQDGQIDMSEAFGPPMGEGRGMNRPEGDRPRLEGDRPRGDGDRPRPDGERRPDGPRDGERRPEGARDGERRPGAPRDGERRPDGPRDGERRPEGARDGERRPEGGPRDGERRPEGPRDGERRPEGDRPRGEGGRPREEGRRRPEADAPRPEGDRPRDA